jgi:hypothetical protein
MTTEKKNSPSASDLSNTKGSNFSQFFAKPNATVEVRNDRIRTIVGADITKFSFFIAGEEINVNLKGAARVTEDKRTGITTLELIPGAVLSFGTNPKWTINGEARFDLRTGNITLLAGGSVSIGDVTLSGARTFNTSKGTFTDQFNVTYDLKEIIKNVKLNGNFGETDGNSIGVMVKIDKNSTAEAGYNYTLNKPYLIYNRDINPYVSAEISVNRVGGSPGGGPVVQIKLKL